MVTINCSFDGVKAEIKFCVRLQQNVCYIAENKKLFVFGIEQFNAGPDKQTDIS